MSSLMMRLKSTFLSKLGSDKDLFFNLSKRELVMKQISNKLINRMYGNGMSTTNGLANWFVLMDSKIFNLLNQF